MGNKSPRKIKQPKEGKIKQPKEGKIKQPKEGKIKNPEVRDVAKGEGNCREGRGRKDQATRRGKPRKAIKQRRVRKRLRMPGRERTKKDLEREERNRRLEIVKEEPAQPVKLACIRR